MSAIIAAARVLNPLEMMIADSRIVELHNEAFEESLRMGGNGSYNIEASEILHRLFIHSVAEDVVNATMIQYLECNGTEQAVNNRNRKIKSVVEYCGWKNEAAFKTASCNFILT